MAIGTVVKIDDVQKKFCRNLKRSLWYGIKDIASELVGKTNYSKELRRDEFYALNGVSLEIKRGECLGMIGRNGAGKTTLLRLLNGLIKPDRGTISIRGNVGALIALGAGFNPILTGKENIYINAAILGIPKKQVDESVQKIVEFADIGKFIDAPVQSYSSGMQVRLGFAIAAQLEPDILLIDEVLAVGDRPFRIKCYNKIGELLGRSGIVLVSHNMADISRICTSVAVLEQGRIIFHGSPEAAIDIYNSSCPGEEKPFVQTSAGMRFNGLRLSKPKITWKEGIDFSAEIDSDFAKDECLVRITIMDSSNQVVGEWRSKNHGLSYDMKKGLNLIEGSLSSLELRNDSYYLNFILSPQNEIEYLIAAHKCCRLDVIEGVHGSVVYQI